MPRYTATPQDVREDFGRQMRAARQEAEVTQAELAATLSLSQGTVADWEAGKYEPEHRTVFAIEHALGMEPGELSSILGYLPASSGSRRHKVIASVRRAIEADSTLDDDKKKVVMATYRALTTPSRCTEIFPRQDATAVPQAA